MSTPSVERPRVVVFDLDGTLWSPEMYELWGGGGAPFRRDGNHHTHVLDRSNTKVNLLGESRAILQMLHFDPAWKDTIVAISSTCDEPSWARECLQMFSLDDARKVPFAEVFKGYEHIYSDRKSNHFRKLLREAKAVDPTIRDDFRDFIFFDNQTNNIHDVSKLGVTCVYCPQGMQRGIWERGLVEWKSRQDGAKKAEL
jgi:magnesium-dependent phosphatase 1